MPEPNAVNINYQHKNANENIYWTIQGYNDQYFFLHKGKWYSTDSPQTFGSLMPQIKDGNSLRLKQQFLGNKFSKQVVRGKTNTQRHHAFDKLPDLNEENESKTQSQTIFDENNYVENPPFLPTTDELNDNHQLVKKIHTKKWCFEYQGSYYVIDDNNFWFKVDKKPENYTSVEVGISSQDAAKTFGTTYYYNLYVSRLEKEASWAFHNQGYKETEQAKKVGIPEFEYIAMQRKLPGKNYDKNNIQRDEENRKLFVNKNKTIIGFFYKGRFFKMLKKAPETK